MEEASPPETSRVSPKYIVHVTHPMKASTSMYPVEEDPWSTRDHRTSVPRVSGGRFHVPKSLKVEIPVFKGDGYVLNWLYQLEHLFAIHDTLIEDRVELCVFYLKDEVLVWWRWLQR